MIQETKLSTSQDIAHLSGKQFMLIKEAVKLDRKWVRLISLLFTYTQLVKLGNTLSVYLEHDLPDTKFASVVADCLQSLGLFDVIVSDCERIADLDMIKKAKLENCNIFVLLLGTVSSKLPLINKELALVEQRNILVVPFYMAHLHKIWHKIPLLSSYQENFIGRDEKGIAIRLLEVVRVMEQKFQVPIESVDKARKELGKYRSMRDRKERPVDRRRKLRSAYNDVIREIFSRLGYGIETDYLIKPIFANEYFDMQVSKNGEKIWVKCLLGPPSREKILATLRNLPKNDICWIVYNRGKVSDQLHSIVQDKSVLFMDADQLARGVRNSVERDFFIRKLGALGYGDLENLWEDQRFLELIEAPRQISNPAILEDSIAQLRNLIKKRDATESKYQELIQKNPWILGAQFESIQDQRSFDDENIPDFIGVRARDGLSDIIEIKQPFLGLFREDGEFNANFNDAWNQIEKYLNFAREEKDFLRRKGMFFDNPKCLLIIGYEIEPNCLRKIRTKERLNPAIEVITYDQLISYAEKTIKFLKEMIVGAAKT